MPPTTATGTDIVLTPRQIDQWPAAEKILGAAGRWPPGHSASFSIPPLERAVPICRRLAALWLDAERVDDRTARYSVLLVLSELLANAIRHSASARVTSRLWICEDLVFVEVCDQGGTGSVPRISHPGSSADHGRGLSLVAASARVWGTRLDADGTCAVWAAVPMAPDG